MLGRELGVRLRSPAWDDDQVGLLDGVADDKVLRSLGIDEDELACFDRVFDLIDQRIGVGSFDGEVLREAGPLRPAHEGSVRVGVDHGDALALIGEDCSGQRGGRRLAGAALRRAKRNDWHEQAFQKAKRFRKRFSLAAVTER